MSEKTREPGHTVCLGWPTIRRVASEGAVYFAEHDVALVAADDLFHADVDAAAEERGRRAGIQAVVVHLITRQWRARLRTDKDVFEEIDNLVAEIRALTPESPVDIAPRDSGKEDRK